MNWVVDGNMICLIGPGDSTKSTILLALEYLFYPSPILPISDLDFYNLETNNPIEIKATITNLPNVLESDEKFGLYLGFWDPTKKQICKEQENGNFLPALQLRLSIKSDLEPEWFIDNLQSEEEDSLRIGVTDRRMLGVAKVGQYADVDLTWARNSALSRLTQKDDLSKIPELLANAERKMNEAVQHMDLSMLDQAIADVKNISSEFGIEASLRANVNRMQVNLRQGAIALHDGNLPFALRGAGSRRLLAMAIHKSSVPEGAVILIDEIESNLEPYRLRHLIRQIRPKPNDNHQVIFTTHSPIAVVESSAQELHVVHTRDGNTTIVPVTKVPDVQGIIRSIPEAFLCRKIIVCEGKTEAGFLVALDELFWSAKHQIHKGSFRYQTMAEAGVVPIESPKSGGTEAPKYAVALAELGYTVAYLGDSDCRLSPTQEEMIQIGVEKVFLWPDKVSIEERLCLDLPWEAIKKIVNLAYELNGEDKSWNDIKEFVKTNTPMGESLPKNFEHLCEMRDKNDIRKIIGKVAKGYRQGEKKKGEWFKRMDKGKKLGELVSRYIDQIRETPTYYILAELENWAYDSGR